MPDTENVASAIAYTKMKEYDHATVFSNEIEFTLEAETEVSLGLVVNLDYKSCLTIKEFILEWEEIEGSEEEEDKEEEKDENEDKEEGKDEEDKEEGEDKDEEDTTVVEKIESTVKNEIIYNLQGIKVVKPEKGTLYIKDGKKFYVK